MQTSEVGDSASSLYHCSFHTEFESHFCSEQSWAGEGANESCNIKFDHLVSLSSQICFLKRTRGTVRCGRLLPTIYNSSDQIQIVTKTILSIAFRKSMRVATTSPGELHPGSTHFRQPKITDSLDQLLYKGQRTGFKKNIKIYLAQVKMSKSFKPSTGVSVCKPQSN